MKIEELKKVIEAAKNNPDFDMNNWGECLVGSYLKDNVNDYYSRKLFTKWFNPPYISRFETAAEYFGITYAESIRLFSMLPEYSDMEEDDNYVMKSKERIKLLVIDRLGEFIWEAENA